MPIPPTRRFDPARFFHPASIAFSGAKTALGEKILANIQAAQFTGVIDTRNQLENPDLAFIADDGAGIQKALHHHAKRGARGAIVLSNIADLGPMARVAGIRLLGPHSYGIAIPALGLNASLFAQMPPRGRIALVGQSPSLARLVIDWAAEQKIGFSHIIGIGGNADMGFGAPLDFLSRDPNTTAILVEIDRLRDPKTFHAAARAAARLRPVIAITPGIRLRDAEPASRAAMQAAFARAGVLLTSTISEFLAAAETLTRVKPARGENLAIIANSAAAGRLAADCALDAGLTLAELAPETAQILALSLGRPPPQGPIHVGRDPVKLGELAALLSSAPEVGGILVVHAPSGDEDNAAIEALIACAKTIKIPLLIAAMGRPSGVTHRHALGEAGLACFETPEAAIAGFSQLLRNRRNRAAARELPPSAVLDIIPDKAAVTARLKAAYATGHTTLVQDEALAIAAAYGVNIIASRHAANPEEAAEAAQALGFPAVIKLSYPDMPANRLSGSIAFDLPDQQGVHAAACAIATRLAQQNPAFSAAGFIVQQQAPRGTQLRIRVQDHKLLGPIIGFGAGGGDPDDFLGLAGDLPPLNLALAHALIERAPIAAALAAHRGQPAADKNAIAAMLVQLSALIIDTPEILRLDLDPIFAHANGAVAASARILLRPEGAARPPLIISPYPSEFITHYEAKNQQFLLRPIRPEDADGYAAMFSRFSADDMRYRFFSAQRSLPTEQITRMTDIDYMREMAFIAINQANGQPAGGARLVRNDTVGTQAEFAVGVEPAAKGYGLATALMHAIIAWGKAHGVTEITGQILADNAPMLAFIQRLGFTIRRLPEEPDIVEAKLEV